MASNIPKRTSEVGFTSEAIAAWIRSIPLSWIQQWRDNVREEIASQVEGLAWAFGPIVNIESEDSPTAADAGCGCTDGTDPDEPADRGFICPHDPRGFAFSTDADEEIAAKWMDEMTSTRRLDQATYENLANLIRQVRMETVATCTAIVSSADPTQIVDQLKMLNYPESK